jgi:signal transduction histidine kinase
LDNPLSQFVKETQAPRPLSNRIWRGVTLQLFLVAVLPLTVLVLLVTIGSLRLHHQAMRALVADRNQRAANSAALSLSNELQHRGATMELLSSILSMSDQPVERLHSIEDQLLLFEGGVAIVDFDGNPTASTGQTPIQTLIDPSGVGAILAQIDRQPSGKAIYLPVISIEGDDYVPVAVGDAHQNALIGLFKPAAMITNGLAFTVHEEPVTILVVDSQYQILYQNRRLTSEEHLVTHPGIQSALDGSGGIEYYQAEDGEHVITTSAIQPVGWALMIEETWEDITSPLLRVTQNAPLIAIPILILSLLAIWFGLRQIVQPMQALEEKTSDLARGNFDTIHQPVGGVPEIQYLQKTLIDMAAQVKEAQNSLHSYIGAITESVESERRNLARELHDDTLQSMIALGQYTQYALHWNKDPKVEKSLDQVMSLAEEGIKNLRRLVQGLRPIYIEDLGLSTALAMLARNVERLHGPQVHFVLHGEERRLKPEVEMALYRIAQEAVNNVHRHSEARNAWISLHFSQDELVLEIRDDGLGFEPPPDPSHYARKGHYGLLGMFERSELIRAKLVIQSSPGKGSQIVVRLSAPA